MEALGINIIEEIIKYVSKDFKNWFSLRLVNKLFYKISENVQNSNVNVMDLLIFCIQYDRFESFCYLLKIDTTILNDESKKLLQFINGKNLIEFAISKHRKRMIQILLNYENLSQIQRFAALKYGIKEYDKDIIELCLKYIDFNNYQYNDKLLKKMWNVLKNYNNLDTIMYYLTKNQEYFINYKDSLNHYGISHISEWNDKFINKLIKNKLIVKNHFKNSITIHQSNEWNLKCILQPIMNDIIKKSFTLKWLLEINETYISLDLNEDNFWNMTKIQLMGSNNYFVPTPYLVSLLVKTKEWTSYQVLAFLLLVFKKRENNKVYNSNPFKYINKNDYIISMPCIKKEKTNYEINYDIEEKDSRIFQCFTNPNKLDLNIQSERNYVVGNNSYSDISSYDSENDEEYNQESVTKYYEENGVSNNPFSNKDFQYDIKLDTTINDNINFLNNSKIMYFDRDDEDIEINSLNSIDSLDLIFKKYKNEFIFNKDENLSDEDKKRIQNILYDPLVIKRFRMSPMEMVYKLLKKRKIIHPILEDYFSLFKYSI